MRKVFFDIGMRLNPGFEYGAQFGGRPRLGIEYASPIFAPIDRPRGCANGFGLEDG